MAANQQSLALTITQHFSSLSLVPPAPYSRALPGNFDLGNGGLGKNELETDNSSTMNILITLYFTLTNRSRLIASDWTSARIETQRCDFKADARVKLSVCGWTSSFTLQWIEASEAELDMYYWPWGVESKISDSRALREYNRSFSGMVVSPTLPLSVFKSASFRASGFEVGLFSSPLSIFFPAR